MFMDILNQGPHMDCKHFVKVPPIDAVNSGGLDCWSVNEYHNWLRKNNITRYRGGHWPPSIESYRGQDITFRFDRIDDAMAFKLAWV